MSEIGYNGRQFQVLLGETVIAAIQSKTLSMNKEPVDVTNDDSDGYRVVLPDAGVRSIDTSIEGVATSVNFPILRTAWQDAELLEISLVDPTGYIYTAEHGFFFGNLEFSGEHDGAVSFTASLQSSGPITITAPAP